MQAARRSATDSRRSILRRTSRPPSNRATTSFPACTYINEEEESDMRDQSRLSNFISVTTYTNPVDIKKLRFIYSAIDKYSVTSGKEFDKIHILEVASGTGGITFPLSSLGAEVTAFDI